MRCHFTASHIRSFLFPLTPALSLGEREEHPPPGDMSKAVRIFAAPALLFLSLRERVRVRGNRAFDYSLALTSHLYRHSKDHWPEVGDPDSRFAVCNVRLSNQFLSDYGMLFVLLLLCAYYSWTTFEVQHPTGNVAGEQLAETLAAAFGKGRACSSWPATARKTWPLPTPCASD